QLSRTSSIPEFAWKSPFAWRPIRRARAAPSRSNFQLSATQFSRCIPDNFSEPVSTEGLRRQGSDGIDDNDRIVVDATTLRWRLPPLSRAIAEARPNPEASTLGR